MNGSFRVTFADNTQVTLEAPTADAAKQKAKNDRRAALGTDVRPADREGHASVKVTSVEEIGVAQ